MKYAASCAAPFSEAARGACVPVGGQPSQRVTAFVRGEGAIGTSGLGFVAMAPTICNNSPFLFVTNAAYAQADISCVSAVNVLRTGVTTSVHNGPYNALAVTPGGTQKPQVVGRIVGAGLSVNYSGTTLNQSGMAYCQRNAAHESVVTSTGYNRASTATLGALPDTIVCPFTRDPCVISDFAATEGELLYSSYDHGFSETLAQYPYSLGDNNFPTGGATVTYIDPTSGLYVGLPTGIIAVTGVAGQTFHYEAIVHIEYVGSLPASLLLPSHADPVGTELVRTTAAQVAEQRALPARDGGGETSIWETFTRLLSGTAKRLIPLAVPFLEKGLMSLIL